MKKPKNKQTAPSAGGLIDIEQYSIKTDRKHLIWFNGDKHELAVFRIPTKHLHFNIQNGRYADKMIQLKADNPGDDIDPQVKKWRDEISKMLRGEYPGTQEDREPWVRNCFELHSQRDTRSFEITLPDHQNVHHSYNHA